MVNRNPYLTLNSFRNLSNFVIQKLICPFIIQGVKETHTKVSRQYREHLTVSSLDDILVRLLNGRLAQLVRAPR